MLLRTANVTDFAFLYEIYKDPTVRNMSDNKHAVSYLKHCQWWLRQIRDENFEGKIITYHGRRIGCICREDGVISIALLPEYRNKGIGTRIIKKFCRKGNIAEVKLNNAGSIKAFEKAGFKMKKLVLEK